MKTMNIVKKIAVAVIAVLFIGCMFIGVKSLNTVLAEGDNASTETAKTITFSETKLNISKSGNKLLIVTAINNTEYLSNVTELGYEIDGYTILESDFAEKNTYYSSITLGGTTQTASDIFGESATENSKLLIWEVAYNAGGGYKITAYAKVNNDGVESTITGVEKTDDYNVKLSAMSAPYSTDVYTFTHNAEGDDTVSWTNKTEHYAKAIVSVSRFKPSKYAQIKVTLNTENAVQVGLYRDGTDAFVGHTNIPAGETVWTIVIPESTATLGSFGLNFNLVFYFDAEIDTSTTNTVNVKIEFLTEEEAVEVKPVVAKGNKDYMPGDTTTVIDGDTVTWTTAKSQDHAVKHTVTGYDSKYKCLKVSMTPTVNCSVGIWRYIASDTNNQFVMLKTHTEITGEITWYIDLSNFTLPESFDLLVYYNYLSDYVGKAGSVTITFDFLTEMPSE